MSDFSHLDAAGAARMVPVGHKPDAARRAVASGFVRLAPATVEQLRARALPKGDVLTVARIAGIQAAKQTAHLIPLCHPLPLHHIDVHLTPEAEGVRIRTEAETIGKTGVEMEALTAASVAALTIYDMCKAVDKAMVIEGIRLEEKSKAEPARPWSPPAVPTGAPATAPPVLPPVPPPIPGEIPS